VLEKTMNWKHSMRSFCSVGLVLLLAGTLLSQEPPRAPREQKGRLRVTVTSTENNEPIAGADVSVRLPDGSFEDSTKTDSQGVANIANVPYGNLVIQTYARGYKNWGGHVDFKNEKLVPVKLEPNEKPKPTPTPTPTSSPLEYHLER
jgi:Carboxypeptidase regulatory-like domain